MPKLRENGKYNLIEDEKIFFIRFLLRLPGLVCEYSLPFNSRCLHSINIQIFAGDMFWIKFAPLWILNVCTPWWVLKCEWIRSQWMSGLQFVAGMYP